MSKHRSSFRNVGSKNLPWRNAESACRIYLAFRFHAWYIEHGCLYFRQLLSLCTGVKRRADTHRSEKRVSLLRIEARYMNARCSRGHSAPFVEYQLYCAKALLLRQTQYIDGIYTEVSPSLYSWRVCRIWLAGIKNEATRFLLKQHLGTETANRKAQVRGIKAITLLLVDIYTGVSMWHAQTTTHVLQLCSPDTCSLALVSNMHLRIGEFENSYESPTTPLSPQRAAGAVQPRSRCCSQHSETKPKRRTFTSYGLQRPVPYAPPRRCVPESQ